LILGCALIRIHKAPSRPSQAVREVDAGLIVDVIGLVPWLYMSSIVLLEQVLGHILESLLVLRNIFLYIFHVAWLYRLFLDFLNFRI
jgi:hypothetical protein